MKKQRIGQTMYDVIDINEYTEHHTFYNQRLTAIQHYNHVLPLRNKTDNAPGIYYQDGNMIHNVIKPTTDEYNSDNTIDYSDSKNLGDILTKDNLVRNMENEILTDRNNVFSINITDKDTPEMKALKTAINAKRVDKRNYESRFEQFQNDMRLLKGNNITLAKLISFCDKFDIDAELILRDKNEGDVPNPIGTEISVNLTER